MIRCDKNGNRRASQRSVKIYPRRAGKKDPVNVFLPGFLNKIRMILKVNSRGSDIPIAKIDVPIYNESPTYFKHGLCLFSMVRHFGVNKQA